MEPTQLMNVGEMWSLHDTVLIGPGMNALGRGWFNSFYDMSLANELPFFNQRNRSSVGLAYNNQDASELMPFGLQMYSIGVEFLVMPFGDSCLSTVRPQTPPLAFGEKAPGDPEVPVVQQQNEGVGQIFQGLMDHASIRLQIGQDEKLVNVCTYAPAGYGTAGMTLAASKGSAFGWFVNYTNGEPDIKNRFKFPIPLDMPRNTNWSVELKMSSLAKLFLRSMGGPETWANDMTPSGTTPNYYVDGTSVAAIRVTVLGKRQVQQRGALHN